MNVRRTALLLAGVMAFSLAGCGKQRYAVAYGESKYYTREDMDSAISAIETKFDDLEGCDLEYLGYMGDSEVTTDNLDWVNGIGSENGMGSFDEVIAFESTLHRPFSGRDEEWQNSTGREGCQWWLARKKGGEWHVLSCGYG